MTRADTYLWFGYEVPDQLPQWINDLAYRDGGWQYTPEGAGCVLDAVMDDVLRRLSPGQTCVVPISGGWDSRILLGAVMDRVPRDQVLGMTFGCPGQLDFDIGCSIGRDMGIRHHAVDLSQLDLTWERLSASCLVSPWTYQPCSYYNLHSLQEVTSGSEVVVSGFLGEALTGAHFVAASSYEQALKQFVAQQRRSRTCRLASGAFSAIDAMPDEPCGSGLTPSECLDIGIRQANCIAPAVTFRRWWGGWSDVVSAVPETGAALVTPLAHPMWAAYWLSAPAEYKIGQALYLNMMKEKFPRLAALPSKYSLGQASRRSLMYTTARITGIVRRSLNHLIPRSVRAETSHFNYMDYSHVLRERRDYSDILERAAQYLEGADIVPWLNVRKIIDEHKHYRADHGAALLVLIGLAVNASVHGNASEGA